MQNAGELHEIPDRSLKLVRVATGGLWIVHIVLGSLNQPAPNARAGRGRDRGRERPPEASARGTHAVSRPFRVGCDFAAVSEFAGLAVSLRIPASDDRGALD